MKYKILMLVVAAMLMVATAVPALAAHGWEPTGWWQWEDSTWWCMGWWYHDENDEWTFESMLCYDTETGETWSWPE